MAKGYIYCITADREADPSFSESDYYDKLDWLGADYVADLDRDDSAQALACTMDNVRELGGAVSATDNEDFLYTFSFGNVQKMQEDYFGPRLAKLKKEVGSLTLADVIRSSPVLDTLLDDDSEMVEFNDGTGSCLITWDNMYRRLKDNVTYYVYGTVVLMH